MTRDKFQIVGDSLIGHGLSFDVTAFGVPKDKISCLEALVDAADVIYKQGREVALLSSDDRFDLGCALKQGLEKLSDMGKAHDQGNGN